MMQTDLFDDGTAPTTNVPEWGEPRYPDANQLNAASIRDLFISLLQRNDRLLRAIEEHAEQEVDEAARDRFVRLDRRLAETYGKMELRGIDESELFERLRAAGEFDDKSKEIRRNLLAELPDGLAEKVDESARRRKAKVARIRRRSLRLAAEELDETNFGDAFTVDLD